MTSESAQLQSLLSCFMCSLELDAFAAKPPVGLRFTLRWWDITDASGEPDGLFRRKLLSLRTCEPSIRTRIGWLERCLERKVRVRAPDGGSGPALAGGHSPLEEGFPS